MKIIGDSIKGMKIIDAGDWYKNGEYTKKHKIRMKLGLGGSMPDGSYIFGHFNFIDKLPFFIGKIWYKFTFRIFNPLCNFILGYEKNKK